MYENLCRFAWFYFAVIHRAVLLSLHHQNALTEGSPRSDRVSTKFIESLQQLISSFADEVKRRVNGRQGRELNETIAYFLKDMLSLIDRGAVFDLMNRYCAKLLEKGHAGLAQLQFNFLAIITSYEHYVPLNLPLPDRIDAIPKIISLFWEKHFLVGLLLNEISVVLHMFPAKADSAIRLSAITTLRNLLIKHDVDPRYQEAKRRERVAGMYFPLILIVLDAELEHKLVTEATGSAESRSLLISFMYIVKNCSRRLLQEWWRKETHRRIVAFFVVLATVLDTFELGNRGLTGDGKKAVFRSKAANKDYLESQFEDPMGSKSTVSLRPRQKADDSTDGSCQRLSKQETNLSRETGLIVLDVLMDFMQDFHEDLNRPNSQYMDKVINMFLLLLSKQQTTVFLSSLFKAVRHVLYCYTVPLFKLPTSYVGDLVTEILRYCNSRVEKTRADACALLYLMVKINFIVMKNFNRMKLQATIGVSKLVQLAEDPARFKLSLEAIVRHAQKDAKMPPIFVQEVKELIARLFTVLRNTIKIRDFAYDPEMTADLYFAISKGYNDSPDLRAAWLANLARYHLERSHPEEAAQCKIVLSALISLYINLLKAEDEGVAIDKAGFLRVSPNIQPFITLPPDACREEDICQSTTFTRQGLLNTLREAVDHFKEHNLFECCVVIRAVVL